MSHARGMPLAALRAAWPVLLGLVAIGVAGGAALASRPRQRFLPGSPPTVRATGASFANTLRVPHLAGTIVLDSDTDDPGWTSLPGPARTGPFELAGGVAARPYSDARLVWGDGHLYLALYAADEDIETVSKRDDGASPGDSFRLLFWNERDDRQFSIEVSPNGTLTESASRSGRPDTTWSSGAHVAREMDGTPDDPADDDEEWVIEMAVPFDRLGLTGEVGESIGFAVSRCDTPKNEERICAGWGARSGEGPGARGRLLLGP